MIYNIICYYQIGENWKTSLPECRNCDRDINERIKCFSYRPVKVEREERMERMEREVGEFE